MKKFKFSLVCRNELKIAIVKAGNNVPNPIMRFEDGGFPDYVISEIHKAGFTAPTPSSPRAS